MKSLICRFLSNCSIWLILALACRPMTQAVAGMPSGTYERIVEWTIESRKQYVDPFNDVDVDVIFSKDGQSWRVPTFWRGGQRWTVRFAPPVPGRYDYRLESTDSGNPDLNGHAGQVSIGPYSGKNVLLRHGPPRVSADRRYFEYADSTPFYWLGDTWWAGLSSRLSWDGFKTLTENRRSKGFTVVQTVAGLVPFEEVCPVDAGCQNEGGAVWDTAFKQINPKFFDYADRRMEHLINSGIVPAMVGAWAEVLDQIGIDKIKKHWRYLIARYGAYPVFWVVGGEISDPPPETTRKFALYSRLPAKNPGAWTEVARYVRSIDPYHHPMAAHEAWTDDPPLQEDALTDFRMFQPGHYGWPSIAIEVAQLNLHYARTAVTKPLVVGEVGYEMLGRTHLEDFQRVAFWLAMLNGAAGHTYGAAGTFESYTADKPFQRTKWSLLTWEEGMTLPGSYQIGLGAKLLQQYPWWRFEPHPDWVSPRGTTLLEPRGGVDEFHVDLLGEGEDVLHLNMPESEWHKRNGDFRQPYAAGIPREVRFIYLPYFGVLPKEPPTILGLEPGIRYRAYYWEPSLGIKIDLGAVERPVPGAVILTDTFTGTGSVWTDYGARTKRANGALSATGRVLAVIDGIKELNAVAAVDAHSDADGGVILRYRDGNNYVAAVYSTADKAIYLVEHKSGVASGPLGRTPVSISGTTFRLTAEVRDGMGIASLTSGQQTTTTPVVVLRNVDSGSSGVMCGCTDGMQSFSNFELRRSPALVSDARLDRDLYDAAGQYRGTLKAPGGPVFPAPPDTEGSVTWDDYGKTKHLLLDAYRPEYLPIPGDWLLVLAARPSASKTP